MGAIDDRLIERPGFRLRIKPDRRRLVIPIDPAHEALAPVQVHAAPPTIVSHTTDPRCVLARRRELDARPKCSAQVVRRCRKSDNNDQERLTIGIAHHIGRVAVIHRVRRARSP
jgi:hypothetical protein